MEEAPVLSIATVVATHNRPDLLASRSLASVAQQTRPPDYLIVVDDSNSELRPVNSRTVEGLKIPSTRVIYLNNQRTPGASGAWNTALYSLHSLDPSAFVAVLDDDDSWEPTYLERCERAALDSGLDMVAAGLVFHRLGYLEGDLLSPPAGLDENNLLVRNIHIQGSNLFVRLRKLLEAGGFDEALTSTTDRDICIRLADLGTVQFGPLNEFLVHHFAEDDRPRLSTAGGDAKRDGLAYFYRKYRGRMSSDQHVAFLDRCMKLFHCDPAAAPEISLPSVPAPPRVGSSNSLVLVVGAITSPDTELTARLLRSLEQKFGGQEKVTLKVVLLENGGPEQASREALGSLASEAVSRGADVIVKTLKQQEADVANGVFDAVPEQLSGRKSIALSRTMLQHYLFLEAKPLPGAVVWILDDDVVLEGFAYGTDGSPKVTDVDYVSAIEAYRESGVSIVLNEITGDPPAPALSCIRTQLVDLYHNLHYLYALYPESPWPDLTAENRLARAKNPDYYYDLSSGSTTQLEHPFWFETGRENVTAGQALREIVGLLPGIFSGMQVFRPLVHDDSGEVCQDLTPSVNRGPATLVFDIQALREFPNTVPASNGADLRRSDMVWSLLNTYAGGRDVFQSRLPVRQARKAGATGQVDFTTMEQDLLGFALYSSLRDLLQKKSDRRQRDGNPPRSRDILEFTDSEIGEAAELFPSYISQRLAALELTFIRVMGLVSALKPFCQTGPSGDQGPWWLGSQDYSEEKDGLRRFVLALESMFTEARLEEFRHRIGSFDVQVVRDFLWKLPVTVDQYRRNTPLAREGVATGRRGLCS